MLGTCCFGVRKETDPLTTLKKTPTCHTCSERYGVSATGFLLSKVTSFWSFNAACVPLKKAPNHGPMQLRTFRNSGKPFVKSSMALWGIYKVKSRAKLYQTFWKNIQASEMRFCTPDRKWPKAQVQKNTLSVTNSKHQLRIAWISHLPGIFMPSFMSQHNFQPSEPCHGQVDADSHMHWRALLGHHPSNAQRWSTDDGKGISKQYPIYSLACIRAWWET